MNSDAIATVKHWLVSHRYYAAAVGVVTIVILALILWPEPQTDSSTSLWNRVFNVASFTALLLAIIEMRRMRAIQVRVGDIAESMSTQYVGEFPDNIDEVISTIESAKKSVVILCDVPGYGHFSRPRDYRRYKAAIDSLDSSITVTATFYDKERAREANKEQLGNDYQRILSSDAFQNYMRFHKKLPNEQPTDLEGFLDHLAANYDRHLEHFNTEPVKVVTVAKEIPMYFWMVDDRVAVFSFPSLSVQPPEVAFKTFDRDLLNIMNRILRDVTKDVGESPAPSTEATRVLVPPASQRTAELQAKEELQTQEEDKSEA